MWQKVVLICSLSMFLLAFLLYSTPEATAHSLPENAATQPSLLITELYPNTATRNELDEYVALTNPCAHAVNLEGWRITDNEGTIIFPDFNVGPNQTVYVTRNASAFLTQQRSVKRDVRKPDFEYGADADLSIPQLQTKGRPFALRNSGDEVILRDARGTEVDAVIYGEATYDGNGWRVEPLEKPREGMIFVRKGVHDTNRCGDWLTLPVGAAYHAPIRFSCTGSSGGATAFVSPDCSFSVLRTELNHASSTVFINLYEFDNPYLMDCIVEALARGVNVKVLLEGSPVGGITNEERYIAETIAESGGDVRLAADPFINHAKYAILDNQTVIVTTENWKTTGVPTNNSFGNRGWGIVLRDNAVAEFFTTVFLEEFYRAKAFSVDHSETKALTSALPQGSYVPVFWLRTVTSTLTVSPVLAPDTALSNATILGTVENAQESILVQQFSAGRFWDDADNTFIAALIAAARRGCDVKVLLDSKNYNVNTWNDNDEAVAWLEQVANEEHLNLEAKLADLDALGLTKVHTKGLVVDSKIVIITSLNWNANSIHNREAGVIVENEEIASFYEEVFFHDWNASAHGPRNGASDGGSTGSAGGPERAGSTQTKMKVLGVALTLISSFVMFRLVKWYKRL